MASKRRRGRPTVPRERARVHSLHVLLTAAEHRLVKRAAQADDLTMSAWARALVLAAIRRDPQ